MQLNNHQKKILLEAREIVGRLQDADGKLSAITGDEAGVLLDMMSIMEEHQEEDPGATLNDLIDRITE
jgi:hypothetical protein